ncbi:SDR family NAD(P)-dependent oxidoreductase [Maridesulfovibrio hydrothermalis]|uniref:Short-chain dehydrogenase/reductase SDR n=1 Tax=Maridesulfovibrio hydrothermalis AM13 = DSM 14728 TaxID=1121451 RepID=L0RCF5_9BACT|nr:SDR family oxidoreductase [Maridesulfovibrio hydrothermalis]CCO24414.1 Short-chain dehydrogenase/reductase SDR [Maridesulfovibrio hydrothermalis AM13 = DSM 14728]
MKNKNVLITGGNKGIGLVLTEKFVADGANVIVVARDFSSFELKNHPQVKTVEYDLKEVAGIPDMIAGLPGIDILINNAGIMYATPHTEYTAEQIDTMLKINIEAPVTLCTAVSKHMIAKGAGRIVNNSSIAGQIGHPDVWYGITKAGMINMTKSFAKILGPSGIVVNAVAPGPIATEMLHTIPADRKKAIKAAVYTGRFGQPEEVASAMHWLATDCPEYINGTCIDINNGSFPR